MLAALPVCNIGLGAILSRKCFPDLVILIKYARLIATGSLYFVFIYGQSFPSTPSFERGDILNFNAQIGEKDKELYSVAPFSIFLVSLLLHSSHFFSCFFFQMNFMIFSFAPRSTSPSLSLSLSLAPRHFPQTGSTVF